MKTSFMDLEPKEIFPDLPDVRKDAGLITSKQIRYMYVLIRQYGLDKEEVEDLGFRHFTSEQATELIESIQNGTFYNKYIRKDAQTLFERVTQEDYDDVPFF